MGDSHGLGRVKSTFDENDFNLKDFIPASAPISLVKESKWEFPHDSLDQGDTPHCTGFSRASYGINYPVHVDYTDADGHRFYYQNKIIDGQPNAENGSSIRSIAKALKADNRIEAYAFAPDMALVKWWLLNRGPMIAGTIWLSGMFEPKPDNTLSIEGDIVGGHAYLLNEWRIDNYIGIQNSWGKSWGLNGKAYISAVDFEKLFNYNGEVMAAVELDNYNQKKECFLMMLLTLPIAKARGFTAKPR